MSRLHAFLVCGFAALWCCVSNADNAIFTQLIEQGVSLQQDELLPLPAPVLADGFDGKRQRETIDSLLAGRFDWDEFTRKSVVSPLLLKLDGGRERGSRIGRRVDLYFVAYGKLAALRDNDKLQQQLDLASADSAETAGRKFVVLSSADLERRRMAPSKSRDNKRWIAVEATLLNKVQLNFTTQNEKSNSEDSLLIASITDARFQSDNQFPNCWRSLSTDDAGRRQIGPPHPYPGMGWYLKATRLAAPEGAVFIEYHLIYAEPSEWFHGANLLQSKLPIVAQSAVRKLRRKMAAE